MNDLALEKLPAVPHVVFGIFNLSIPNIIMWGLAIVLFAAAVWVRLPKFIEHSSKPDRREVDK